MSVEDALRASAADSTDGIQHRDSLQSVEHVHSEAKSSRDIRARDSKRATIPKKIASRRPRAMCALGVERGVCEMPCMRTTPEMRGQTYDKIREMHDDHI